VLGGGCLGRVGVYTIIIIIIIIITHQRAALPPPASSGRDASPPGSQSPADRVAMTRPSRQWRAPRAARH